MRKKITILFAFTCAMVFSVSTANAYKAEKRDYYEILGVSKTAAGVPLRQGAAGPHRIGVYVGLCGRRSDLAKSVAFYEAVFGLVAVPFANMDSYWIFEQGGVTTGGLIELSEAMSGPEGSHWRVYAGVADIDGSCERTVALGGRVEIPAFDAEGIGQIAFIRDPFDIRLGIIQPVS